jgi:cephalosporin-C deacetylase-like acetyl esterase
MRRGLSRQLSVCLLLLLLAHLGTGWAQEPGPGVDRTHAHGSVPAEDWSSLSLADSHLQAEEPVVGERDDFPQFTRELMQVKWRQGDPIDLYVIRPKGVAKPPVVLYLYGYPAETDRFRDNDYCVRVTANGFAAIGFVSALTGHRYHGRPMKEWFVSELQESLGSSVHDVQMILNFLSTRDDLDLSKVGMFGEGSGGTIAVLAAAADPRIKAIDLLDPWGDWPDWVRDSNIIPENERANYLQPEFLQKVAGLDQIGRAHV